MQDVQKQVGATIRAFRSKKGWTQDLFADKSGIHRADVGAIERGERNLTLKTLKILADTLKVRITDLLDGL
jgi:transcriptional regulator with XRE-family HTH domain